MWFFWALLLLGILVLAHEMGHFVVAKLTGVKVIRFSIGFGPRLVKFTFGETEYAISAIPLGGYVKLLAQESSEPIPPGVLNVEAAEPAYLAGLRRNDLILKVQGQPVENWTDVQDLLEDVPLRPISMEIEREGQTLAFSIPLDDPAVGMELPEQANGRSGGMEFPDLGLSVGDHPELIKHAFFQKPVWQRFLVVLAGPLASLLFPGLIYFVYFMAITDLPSTRIGQVLADSPSERAGLQPGDLIMAVDGRETQYWSDMAELIAERGGENLALTVERDGQTFTRSITPDLSTFRNMIGDEVSQGRIGITSSTIPAIVGPDGSASPAAKAGVRLGDRLTAVNGQPIRYIWELDRLLAEVHESGRALLLDLERRNEAGETTTRQVKLVPKPSPDGMGFVSGLYSADVIVKKLDEGSPAALAGFQSGDVVLAVDGRRISAWLSLELVLREKREAPITFTLLRDGQTREVVVSQVKEVVKGEMNEDVTRYRFGAFPAISSGDWLDGERIPIRGRFAFAVSASTSTLMEITLMEIRVFVKLFSGDIALKMLGGPIMIFDVAGRAAERGWQSYLWIMAMISINLGLLNLLPIPVLDGGHLMFFTIEAITRRPLNQKLKERALMVGFAMLMTLMALVFKNDLERYWDRIFG